MTAPATERACQRARGLRRVEGPHPTEEGAGWHWQAPQYHGNLKCRMRTGRWPAVAVRGSVRVESGDSESAFNLKSAATVTGTKGLTGKLEGRPSVVGSGLQLEVGGQPQAQAG